MSGRHSPRSARAAGTVPPGLPAGAAFIALPHHRDPRGGIFELFQERWDAGIAPVQWNLFSNTANVLRGMHVHLRHTDYIVMVAGTVLVALRDLRRGSPTDGRCVSFELAREDAVAVVIPPGVGHLFYYADDAHMLQGSDCYYDPEDELGCHWADPDLGLDWPAIEPILSERDRNAPTLSTLRERLPPFSAF